VRHALLAILVLSAFVVGCGGKGQDADRPQVDAAASDSTTTGETAVATQTVASPVEPARSRPLTAAERRRLLTIATSVDGVIDLFDETVRACPDVGWEACVDRAWSALYSGMVGPQLGHGAPHYLRQLHARTRGCESLAVAVKGVNSFNLAAKQLEYGDPAEVGTATGRRDRFALVDMLRPAPSELRSAATSACR
jgi:hypothetical protein